MRGNGWWVLALGLVACGAGDEGDAGAGGTGGNGPPGPVCSSWDAVGRPGAGGCSLGADGSAPAHADQLLSHLHGRWKRCGGATLPAGAAGIEFRPGGFWQFLRETESGALVGNFDVAGWEVEPHACEGGWELVLRQSSGHVIRVRPTFFDGGLRLQFDGGDGPDVTAWYVSVR